MKNSDYFSNYVTLFRKNTQTSHNNIFFKPKKVVITFLFSPFYFSHFSDTFLFSKRQPRLCNKAFKSTAKSTTLITPKGNQQGEICELDAIAIVEFSILVSFLYIYIYIYIVFESHRDFGFDVLVTRFSCDRVENLTLDTNGFWLFGQVVFAACVILLVIAIDQL